MLFHRQATNSICQLNESAVKFGHFDPVIYFTGVLDKFDVFTSGLHNCETVTETHTMFLSPSFSRSLSVLVYFICLANNAAIVLPKQLLVMFEQCKIHKKTRCLHVLRNA